MHSGLLNASCTVNTLLKGTGGALLLYPHLFGERVLAQTQSKMAPLSLENRLSDK